MVNIRSQALLVTLEVVAIAVVALVRLPVPPAVALLAVATLSLSMRRLGFIERLGGTDVAYVGMVTGIAAAAATLLLAEPLVLALTSQKLLWLSSAMVRGNLMGFAVVAMISTLVVIASELALRGWLLPRVRDLVGGSWPIALAVVLVVEMAITPGSGVARLGMALVGFGAGLLYVGAGGRLGAPIVAHATLQVSLLAVEAMRLRG